MTARLGPSKPCPCQSNKTYGECCRPFHRGEREPGSAEALMRSRFSAFALSEIDHLVRTLASDHEDRGALEEALRASLREVCRTGRFLGLRVLESREDGDTAIVRFHARVFAGGADRSFEEKSEFRREAGAWRYVGACA